MPSSTSPRVAARARIRAMRSNSESWVAIRSVIRPVRVSVRAGGLMRYGDMAARRTRPAWPAVLVGGSAAFWNHTGTSSTAVMYGCGPWRRRKRMTDNLFRPEVQQARETAWLGATRLPSPRIAWPMTLLSLALLLCVAAFLTFGQYVRKVRVQGLLVPSQGLLAGVAPSDGMVTRVRVEEGDLVDARQPLIEIVSSIESPRWSSGDAGAAVAGQIERQRALIEADMDMLESIRARDARALDERISALRGELDAAQRTLQLRERQARLAQTLLARVRPLQHERIVSDVQIAQYEADATEAGAAAEQARQTRSQAGRRLAEAEADLAALRTNTQLRSHDLQRRLAGLSRDAARNAAEGGALVRAPKRGVVSGLAVDAGQSVARGQRLFSLIPEGAALRAELWAPSDAIGELSPGTRVALRYRAFPFRRYGVQSGRVLSVSRSALSPEEIRRRNGMKIDAPAYRVLVVLDPQIDRGSGRALPLRASMHLDADLLLERRRLYEYMLFPSTSRSGA
ncbi:MAG: HlyD family efflux transporter periplasmic adaptor subunit [Lysobacteraceae bacterium]|nr:MAG: HlyD family efflux transporter periplasmic adaptor subunit [Xanthomonadaceae bacterium]